MSEKKWINKITRLIVQDLPLEQIMVENSWKWREGQQQITRLVQDGPTQLMVENPGKRWEGPHWFLRTTNKTNIEKENTNHFFFYYCFLSLFPSILFCFVSSIMGVNLYTSFQKYCCFWLEKRGSTYTLIDLYMRKYGRQCIQGNYQKTYCHILI